MSENGRELVVTGDRQRNLLAALLVREGRTVSFDALAEAVWDGRPPKGVRGALHTSLARLRAQLGSPAGGRIFTEGSGYRFELGPGELDLHRFEAAAERGRQAASQGAWDDAHRHLSEACALWRGAPLEGLTSTTLVEVWTAPLRQRLLGVQLEQLDAALQLGRQAEVLPDLLRLCQEHPLDERLYERLMLALYRDSRTSDALAAFRQARRALVRDLGVEPGPALQSLQERILAADPALSAPTAAAPELPRIAVPAQLPARLADFTGRDGELQQLTQVLSSTTGGVPIAVLSGCGGLGKSALAVQAAHRVRNHFPDGQLFAALASHSGAPRQVGEILSSFLLALGAEPGAIPAGDEDRADLFRTLVADRRVLIVLDDAHDAAHIRPLLPGGSGCAVLITSRDRMSELSGSTLLDLEVLSVEESRELLASIAGASRIAAEPEAVDRILEACAGLPLAVRIVGARLAGRPSWSLTYLAARLADQNTRLRELRVGDLAVAASFAMSYESVRETDTAQGSTLAHTFRLLGLVTGPTIGLSTAGALLGRPLDEVEEAMESLVDGHLLDSAHPGRYRFHDLLRAFARQAAHEEEQEEARTEAVDRLLTFFRDGTAAAAAQLNPARKALVSRVGTESSRWSAFPDRTAALRWLDAERSNLLAACRQAAGEGFPEFAWELARNMAQYFMLGGHIEDHITSHQLALEATRKLGDRAAEHACVGNLSIPYWQSGRYPEALEAMWQAHALAVELGDTRGEATCLIRIGVIHGSSGDQPQAIVAYQQALPILREIGELQDVANALSNLGYALSVVGRSEEALETLQEAVALARETGDVRSEGNALIGLGQTLAGLGRPGEALDHLRGGLAAVRRCQDYRSETEALIELADVFRCLDLPGPALDHAHQALELLNQKGDLPLMRALLYNALGAIHRSTGDLAKAREHHTLAQELALRIGNPGLEATAREGLAG